MKTDSQIQVDVLEDLKWEPSVNHEHIGVAVTNGIVTLTGTVSTITEKKLAEDTALKVPGVKGIVEHLKVILIAK